MGQHYSKSSSNPTLSGNTNTYTKTTTNKNTNQNTATNTINNNNCNTTTSTNTAATAVTVEQSQSNRTPKSPVINLQFENSPTGTSLSSLSSSTSLNRLRNLHKQIIIKIQLAEMESGNGNEQQQQAEQQQQNQVRAQSQAHAQDVSQFLEMDANSNLLLNGLDDQILNITRNRNCTCGDMISADVSSVIRPSSSTTEAMNRTAGSIASSLMPPSTFCDPMDVLFSEYCDFVNSNSNGRQMPSDEDELFLKYCDFVRKGDNRQMQASAAADNEEFVMCDGRDADNNNCCQLSKSRSTSSSHSTTKSPSYRSTSKLGDVFRRIWEPSSSKSNKNKERKDNSNKQQKQQPQPHQHSNDSSSDSVLPPSAACPYHHRTQPQQHQEIQRNSSNHLILQYPPSISNSNSAQQQPISIAATSSTAAAPEFPNNNNNSMSTNPQLSFWNSNDVILPLNSPQVFVVCPPTSRVTLGHINDNAAIRVTTEIVGGGSANGDTAIINTKTTQPNHLGAIVHSQVDFMHFLVPDLERIINSSYYWGKMDRYEAERLLEGKPEGTFLLRDSAQEEFLFSVTFRKYGRSLHARIEQRGHRFSFDCHDPGVFTAPTVTGLLEHYKDPACVMFFEPMLTIPFHRKMVFSLQQLARATIVSSSTYDGVNQLELPTSLKEYIKEYHYKQKLRAKPFDKNPRLRFFYT